MKYRLRLLIGKFSKIFIRFLPLISFITPISILYLLRPGSFLGIWEGSWQGRFLYLFFLWLCSLEVIIGYEKLSMPQINRRRLFRMLILIMSISLPTIYIIVTNFLGLNEAMRTLAKRNMIYHAHLVPLSVEYMSFSVLLCVIVILVYGVARLEEFSISITFLGIVGLIYSIDQLYPFGRFTPFQSLVFPTANIAQNVLNLLGYTTSLRILVHPILGYISRMHAFDPTNPMRRAIFDIAWPCAGVEGLIIYTLTILLFLKKSSIPKWQKIIYFATGSVITYLINVLRIVSIFLVGMYEGPDSAMLFHNLYGPLYSIAWIVSYPLVIMRSRILWNRIKHSASLSF